MKRNYELRFDIAIEYIFNKETERKNGILEKKHFNADHISKTTIILPYVPSLEISNFVIMSHPQKNTLIYESLARTFFPYLVYAQAPVTRLTNRALSVLSWRSRGDPPPLSSFAYLETIVPTSFCKNSTDSISY